jgi:hypothetical protein
MSWPKIIVVRGLQIPVDDWEEVDQAIQRYGGEPVIVTTGPVRSDDLREGREVAPARHTHTALGPQDRALLQQLIEGAGRGVLTAHIGPVLDARGKGLRPALERWSRQIGLVPAGGGSAFAPVRRNDGRAYRLTEVHLRAAREMLGQAGG